ncbi:MAG: YggU family protein [Gammaproteobacteria bacterium]|nr:YggU family protein [Gammaproteobacteria bacterium]
MSAAWYRWDGDDLVIQLRVTPRASKNEIAGPYGDALKVRITAPPVEGAANAHLIEWFAKLSKVPKAQITLEAGDKARSKRIRIHDPLQLIHGVERA